MTLAEVLLYEFEKCELQKSGRKRQLKYSPTLMAYRPFLKAGQLLDPRT